MRVLGPRSNTPERADIDDPSLAMFAHLSGGLLAAKERRFQIHVMDEIPIGFRYFQRVEPCEARRVIDQAVQWPRLSTDFAKHAPDVGDVAEIGLKDRRIATFLRSLAGFLLRLAIVNCHAEALRRQA